MGSYGCSAYPLPTHPGLSPLSRCWCPNTNILKTGTCLSISRTWFGGGIFSQCEAVKMLRGTPHANQGSGDVATVTAVKSAGGFGNDWCSGEVGGG